MDSTTLQAPSSMAEADPQKEAPSLYQALQQITDGRKRRGVRSEVALILRLLLLGRMAGCQSVAAVAQWVQLRTEILLPLFPIDRQRFPCQATYGNVLKKLDAQQVSHILAEYFRRREKERQASGKEEKAHVTLDGKTLRGTLNHLDEHQASVHLLSLYETATGTVLAQRPVGSKQNEISALQNWLSPLLVKDRLLTTDALHSQRGYCADVVRFGGDYILIVKKNQPTVYEDLRLYFTDPEAEKQEWGRAQTWNKGHGRLEWREITTTTLLNPLFERDWAEVGQTFQIHRRVQHKLKCTQERVYGMTSLTPAKAEPARLLSLVRAHWEIENRLHYRRDVTLGEDLSQVRTLAAPLVLAALNNAVLSFMDSLGVTTVPVQMRIFEARPHEAVSLLLTSP